MLLLSESSLSRISARSTRSLVIVGKAQRREAVWLKGGRRESTVNDDRGDRVHTVDLDSIPAIRAKTRFTRERGKKIYIYSYRTLLLLLLYSLVHFLGTDDAGSSANELRIRTFRRRQHRFGFANESLKKVKKMKRQSGSGQRIADATSNSDSARRQ